MGSLVLALFPGIGLLDRVFEGEGFCVVRGPDVLWGGDIRRFHPSAGVFVAAPDRSKQRTVGTYVWDPTDWQLYIQRGRNQQEVCNFLPEILGDIEIDKSDGNVTRAWGCRFTLRDGKKVEFYLPAEDRGFSKLSDALSRRCPADYVVEPAMQDHLRSAMPKRSYGTWRRSREFATLGAAGQVFLKFVREVFGRRSLRPGDRMDAPDDHLPRSRCEGAGRPCGGGIALPATGTGHRGSDGRPACVRVACRGTHGGAPRGFLMSRRSRSSATT